MFLVFLRHAAAALSSLATTLLVRTVGSLDAVNARVAARGLQQRALLPFLVADTVDCIEPVPVSPTSTATATASASAMPPKRRGATHPQARRLHKPVGSADKQREETTATVIDKPAIHQEEKKTSLIELATYPGFTPSSPTPLPHCLDTLEQMRRVTRAQAKIAAKREGYREYWRENFYSPASQTIFLDTFWWFFLERYQPFKAVQSSLFSRVAENYVKFLVKSEVHTWKDKFLKAYPDALAQCVYTAFIHAFPASWSSFDDSFKSALVEIVYLWQTGTRPMPELWKKWNFEYLDPPDSLKAIGQDEKQQTVKTERSFRLDELVEAARTKAGEGVPVTNRHELSDHQSRDGSSNNSSPHQSNQTISRTQLEKELARKLFQESRGTSQGAAATVSQVERGPDSSAGRLDIACSQYLRLCQEKRAQKNDKSQSEPDTREMGETAPSKPLGHTKSVSTGNEARPSQVKAGAQSVAPLPPLPPNKTTGDHSSRPAHRERPPGTVKPSSEAEETRGRANIVLSVGGRRYKKMNKVKGVHLGAKVQPPSQTKATPTTAKRGGCTTAKPTTTARREEAVKTEKAKGSVRSSSTREDRGQNPSRDCGKGREDSKRGSGREKQAQSLSGSGQAHKPGTATANPPPPPPPSHGEKPAGSLKPASKAKEYGLSNYVSGSEGGKERTWKEMAISAREKTSQKPISILHRLHHQGTPLAVPEMESVCFNLFGQSPLVKHYLQKKRLNKVAGYAVLTKRTEFNEVIPPGAPTYDDVIQESLRENEKRTAHFATQKRECKKHHQKILQERMKKRQTYKQQLRKLLSAQKEVESLSNELVDYWQERGMDRQQGVSSLKHSLSPDMQRTLSSCINQAFQKCSNTSS